MVILGLLGEKSVLHERNLTLERLTKSALAIENALGMLVTTQVLQHPLQHSNICAEGARSSHHAWQQCVRWSLDERSSKHLEHRAPGRQIERGNTHEQTDGINDSGLAVA